jgi:hypothetical protein
VGGFGGWRGEDEGVVGDGLRAGDDVRGGSLLGGDVHGSDAHGSGVHGISGVRRK